jgi:hypothetical protein
VDILFDDPLETIDECRVPPFVYPRLVLLEVLLGLAERRMDNRDDPLEDEIFSCVVVFGPIRADELVVYNPELIRILDETFDKAVAEYR